MNAVRPADDRPRAVQVARPTWDDDQGWQELALCRGENPDLFFPPQHLEKKEEREMREAQAKAVCARCPVRQQCLAYAIATREPYGVWGGLNEHERRRIAVAGGEREAG